LANKTRSTFAKRQKELARQARGKNKHAKRLEKKAESESRPTEDATTEDPDLIGIKLGPQPPADYADLEEDEAGDQEGR
jgi:hypothetical protein